jgi:hypothetical protein
MNVVVDWSPASAVVTLSSFVADELGEIIIFHSHKRASSPAVNAIAELLTGHHPRTTPRCPPRRMLDRVQGLLQRAPMPSLLVYVNSAAVPSLLPAHKTS